MPKRRLKRPNGTGAISFLGKNRRNAYCARIHAGNGKYEVLGYYPSRKAAEEALTMYNAQKLLGLAPPPGCLNVTIGQCWDLWSARELEDASHSKRMNYEAPWRRRLIAYADRPIRSMGVDDWQKIVDDDVAAGLASNSVVKLIGTIRALCKYAMERDYISKDYSVFIQAPRSAPVHEKGALTHEQIAELVRRGAAGDLLADAAVLLCYTGFRIEELLPLTECDLDREAWTLTGGEKTEAGRGRIVPVCSNVRPTLLRLLDQHGDTIICKRNGTRYSDGYFRTLFKSMMAEIGAEGATPHWTRYTFNTLCHEGGVDLLTQKWLTGHSTEADITHHYTMSTLAQLQAAVELLWWPE